VAFSGGIGVERPCPIAAAVGVGLTDRGHGVSSSG
jgi:hypothetical protein